MGQGHQLTIKLSPDSMEKNPSCLMSLSRSISGPDAFCGERETTQEVEPIGCHTLLIANIFHCNLVWCLFSEL